MVFVEIPVFLIPAGTGMEVPFVCRLTLSEFNPLVQVIMVLIEM